MRRIRNTVSDRLSEIPMSAFIRMYTGGEVRFRRGVDRDAAAARLVSEYNAIVGERNMRAKVSARNRLINRHIRLNAAVYAQRAAEDGDMEYAADILAMLGYKVSDESAVRGRIASVIAAESFAIDRENRPGDAGRRMTEADFTRERVAIMRHYRMHIDTDEYSAEEYAYLVRSFCEEVDSLRRRAEASRRKNK